MLKFVYIILISCLLGFFTFQLSQDKLYIVAPSPALETSLPDSTFLSAEKLPVLKIDDRKTSELGDFDKNDEIYYESGDASMKMLYAIFQFVWKLYE